MSIHSPPELDYPTLLQRYRDLQHQHHVLQTELQKLAGSAAHEPTHLRAAHGQTQAQEKAEKLQSVFYEIAERASAGLSFFDFLEVVHHLLGKLLYAKNCFVCLHDVQAGVKHYPYFVDERDADRTERLNVPRCRGMTEFVLDSGQPQIIDSKRLAQLRAQGEMPEAMGDMTFTAWLGVPMRVAGELTGVLVVQAYEPGVCYDEEDADILLYVASHVGNAIERVRVLEELRKSEERYRTVIENVGVGVAVFQKKQLVFANQKAVQIVGYPLDFLYRNAYTAVTRPQDLGIQVEPRTNDEQRAKNETSYLLHLETQDGHPRDLEMVTVPLEWEGQRATLMFVVDVTAREAAERVQKAAVRKQVELAAMQSRFITMASHEYRTPLTTIYGSVELLQHYEDRMSPEKKREILQKVSNAVKRMTHMLDKVLVIGRSDAGELSFNPKPVAITPLCLLLVEELRTGMPDASYSREWVLDLPEHTQQYLLDEVLIRHIVGNLLSNAVKYSHPGGKVGLALRAEAGSLELTVTDDGIGIPTESQAQLFERFHRADNVGAVAGTGLGLAIVKEAVQCHGGSISVRSAVNNGSQFIVCLPIGNRSPGEACAS